MSLPDDMASREVERLLSLICKIKTELVTRIDIYKQKFVWKLIYRLGLDDNSVECKETETRSKTDWKREKNNNQNIFCPQSKREKKIEDENREMADLLQRRTYEENNVKWKVDDIEDKQKTSRLIRNWIWVERKSNVQKNNKQW